ncbi:MAG: cysteine--tRNA ligase [Armatimonadetes bacterium]|nr:cysteine--tRNA ligase [Armatimonadota bacterium]
MSVKLYNTLTHQKEEVPLEPEKTLGMYVCGLTVQGPAHIGHLRGAVVIDVFRRYLRFRGYHLRVVQNFTDIEDKIITRAREEGLTTRQLSEKYIRSYLEDVERLGAEPADLYCRATDHIPEIIEMIECLVERGYAYAVEGDVYFAVESFPEYGKLSRRPLDEMKAGARVEVDERKRNPLDFALWKAAKPGEPSWDSPWGPGRPGWHIECSAMSLKYLGTGFDIHAGGPDLIFPHHENEIAQSEACRGQQFAKLWFHWGFVNLNAEKMSKSVGNILTLKEIIARYDPEALRFYLLSTHYRSPVEFDFQALEESRKGLDRLRIGLANIERVCRGASERPGPLGEEGRRLIERAARSESDFVAVMDDDLNTARGLGCLFDLVNEFNAATASGWQPVQGDVEAFDAADGTLRKLGGIFGLFQGADGEGESLVPDLMNLLIEVRQLARQKKDWAMSDKIRDGLKTIGVILEDRADGTSWRKA